MLRDEPAQRQRMIHRVPLRLGQELEEDARTGVVVVDGRDDDERARAAQRPREQSQLVVHRRAAPVDGAG